jgi:tetratricopeptide (TPR) repeat protein
MKAKIILVIFLVALSVSARIRTVLFPFENASGNSMSDWIGYGIPDRLFRIMYSQYDVQTWEPIFLFQTDSSAWKLDSDSLLLAHANRWKWDIAVGGSFTTAGDSVWIRMRAARTSENTVSRKEWKVKGTVSEVQQICGTMAYEVLAYSGYEMSTQEAEMIKAVKPFNSAAYATFARGVGYEMRGRYSEALSAYSHAASIDKNIPCPWLKMGQIYERSKSIPEAREAFAAAVTAGKNDPYILARAAMFYVRNDTRQKSEAFVNQYKAQLESCSEGMSVFGMMYSALGEYQRAAGLLTRAMAQGPSYLETDYALGRTFIAMGDYEQAAEVFRRLITYRPRHIRYYSLLGAVYRKSRRLMESVRILEMAVEYEPRDVDCLINLSVTYYAIGWYGKAEQMLLRARDIEPKSGGIYLNLGVIYWQTGKAGKAREMFALASEHPSSAQDAYNNEGNILLLGGDLKNAIKTYSRADKAGGRKETIIYNMGQAYLSLGKTKEAASCFDDVLLMSPGRLDVLLIRADLASKMNDTEAAEGLYRKIVQIDPRNRAALTRLVDWFIKEGRLDEAVDFCKSTLKEFPGDRTMRLLLPSIYSKIGWHEAAIVEYENLVVDNEFANEFQCYSGMGKSMYFLITEKNQRNYESALSILRKAESLGTADAELEYMIGDLYLTYMLQPSLAAEHLVKALDKPSDIELNKKIRARLAEASK